MSDIIFTYNTIIKASHNKPEGYLDDILSKAEIIYDNENNITAVKLSRTAYELLKIKYTPGYKSSVVYGVGSELKKLLKKFGIVSISNCKCDKRAQTMNNNGVDWCENNIETIVNWMEEEAKNRNFPFVRYLATILVKKAIKNTKISQNLNKGTMGE